ncbi:MAG: PTS glucitol/sorbitol transporter subunit IIA [Selenomonadaceae bacterium]|nr:PTS glucitol/sorbitol transporter subunit IIA [Selenomonadaceae bacterium]MBR1858909.1 PTS glucitol/sorbitol transporter subunit IIA [Selenomonadaceae bacterium]
MEIKYETTITAVGKLAREFLDNNNSLILLNEGIHPNLSDMVVEHKVSELAADIEVGDKLKIGNTDFKVMKVGDVANKTIRESGHCTIVVNADGSMPGQIIVKGVMPPRLRIGDNIKFFKK